MSVHSWPVTERTVNQKNGCMEKLF
jgi:hypothetical protein